MRKPLPHTLLVSTLGHELCAILKREHDKMACQHAYALIITGYESPAASHATKNEESCPRLALPFAVQAA